MISSGMSRMKTHRLTMIGVTRRTVAFPKLSAGLEPMVKRMVGIIRKKFEASWNKM